MKPLNEALFAIYALSLPRGHGFGRRPPASFWTAEDGRSCGVVTRDCDDGSYGVLAMRRRSDHVWSVLREDHGFRDEGTAHMALQAALDDGAGPLSIPNGARKRPALYDLKGKEPSSFYQLLRSRSHQPAAWLLNELYLAMPRPDANWVSDFQTVNFHTRMWEAHLLACFREQGLLVSQPHSSPDFRIENRKGGVAWVEAVTANPQTAYEHVGVAPVDPPEDRRERTIGPAAVRFAKTLKSKLDRKYETLAHVAGQPFALAIADFHGPGSMVWSREALMCYLYGYHAQTAEILGEVSTFAIEIERLLGDQNIPAGPFRTGVTPGLSAVIFTNTGTVAKFNRVAVSGGYQSKGYRYMRIGRFYDLRPGAVEGIPFCLDVATPEYRKLWKHIYEPWCADLEVFHNPLADIPLPPALLPEATHWVVENGEIQRRYHYETSILTSRTWIQPDDRPAPTLYDLLPRT